MRVLVTGGTGFLGREASSALRAAGYEVRTLARSPTATHPGSILSTDDLDRALAGCQAVVHLAGRVDRRPEAGPELEQLHVEGTRKVLERAAVARVRRVIYGSTSGTVAVGRTPQVHRESDPPPLQLIESWPYYRTKLRAERLALKLGASLGLEVISLNPSLLLGPGDAEGSSAEDVLRALYGPLPALPTGGLSFVDVRDVAEVVVHATTRGRPGSRYLLGAANWSLRQFFQEVGALAGRRIPRRSLPVHRLAPWIQRLPPRLRPASLDPISLELSGCYWYLDARLAEAELGFRPRSPRSTLADTVAYWAGRRPRSARSPAG